MEGQDSETNFTHSQIIPFFIKNYQNREYIRLLVGFLKPNILENPAITPLTASSATVEWTKFNSFLGSSVYSAGNVKSLCVLFGGGCSVNISSKISITVAENINRPYKFNQHHFMIWRHTPISAESTGLRHFQQSGNCRPQLAFHT